MKKLLLLLALIIVACSDDSSDSNQLFLEKYDGFVWRWSDQPYEDRKITFSSNILGLIIFLGPDNEDREDVCSNITFGEPVPVYQDDEIIKYATYTIQSEVEDSIVIYLEEVDIDGNITDGVSLTFTVSSGGNVLQFEAVYDGYPDDILTTNYTIAPNEFPCN
jgi:hypothetical protein